MFKENLKTEEEEHQESAAICNQESVDVDVSKVINPIPSNDANLLTEPAEGVAETILLTDEEGLLQT